MNKRKPSSLVAEPRRAVVAHQTRAFAEQNQIEIVVMIVIEPDRPGITPRWQRHRAFLEAAFLILIERSAISRNYREVSQAIIIKIPHRHPSDSREGIETTIRRLRSFAE